MLEQSELLKKVKFLKMFIMDVDGTLTDGKIYLGNDGEELKAFNVKDGMGISLLRKKGIIPVLITGRESEIVNIRARELGIEDVYQGIKDKLEIYTRLKDKYQLSDQEISYVGDDLNDLTIMKEVGVSFTVNDGATVLREKCDYCAKRNGGDGAIREIIDLIIK